MSIENHFNVSSTSRLREAKLNVNRAQPVMATPAMLGIIAVTVVTSAAGGALGVAAAR